MHRARPTFNLQSASPCSSFATHATGLPPPRPSSLHPSQTLSRVIHMPPTQNKMSPLSAFLPSVPHPLLSSLSTPPPAHHLSSRPSPRPPPRGSVAPPPSLHNPSDHEQAVSSVIPPITGMPALNIALSSPVCPAPDTLIVVMFHARWCRVCKTLAHKILRVAPTYPSVVWLSVDFAEKENKALCRDLGVRLLPTFRFYRPGMAADDRPLEEFTSGPFGIKRVQERLEPYCVRLSS